MARTHHLRGSLSTRSIHNPRETAERIAGHLRWSGIACEPVVIRSLPAGEVPAIARACCADRVLVSAPIDAPDSHHRSAIADRIIDGLDIPVCVVGRTLSVSSRYQRPSRRITLLLSLRARNEIPIAFASRFAQESHSQLTIMHVFPKGAKNGREMGQMQASFVAQLPSTILREAELLCPVEIAVREGDPTAEILNYDSAFNQDFLVLAPPRDAGPIGFDISSVRKIIRAAQCPVIVLAEQADAGKEHRRAETELCAAVRH